jgi:hypothetical protein
MSTDFAYSFILAAQPLRIRQICLDPYDIGPLFGRPHQRSTMYDQRPLYRRRSQGFAPLDKVGFIPHRGKGCRDSVSQCAATKLGEWVAAHARQEVYRSPWHRPIRASSMPQCKRRRATTTASRPSSAARRATLARARRPQEVRSREGSPKPRTPGGHRSLDICSAIRLPLPCLVAHQDEREPALKAPRRSSKTHQSGRRPCRSARRRRSWSTASAPAHRWPEQRTAARPRPRSAP